MRTAFRNARLAKGLTQAELGRLVMLTRKGIWAIEHGRSKGSVDVWDRLEAALGLDQKILRQADPVSGMRS
jgi:transcriptional regulator with XRE-family HTH domain